MSETPLDPALKTPLSLRRFGMGSSGFSIELRGESIASLAVLLEPETRRVVADRTGLKGSYDIDLKFQSEFMAAATPGWPTPESATSLATSLREQLGLRLRSVQGPVDVIVIDRAELPTPN